MYNFSNITGDLFIGTTPLARDYDGLRELGIRLIINMRLALETIQSGGKVYVHCAGGRHRGVAMGSCVLIAQGYDPDEAMKLIMARRAIADPYAYYIRPRILKFAKEWSQEQ
jgi:hypothetical protein